MVTLLTQLNWKIALHFADDPAVHKRLAEIKSYNKLSLKRYLKANKGIELDETQLLIRKSNVSTNTNVNK